MSTVTQHNAQIDELIKALNRCQEAMRAAGPQGRPDYDAAMLYASGVVRAIEIIREKRCPELLPELISLLETQHVAN